MTTNVLDRIAGVLSSDSRWSVSQGDLIAYVDNTDYDKLVYTNRVGFLFAGDMPQIDPWKAYILAGMKKGTRPTQTIWTKMSVIQVDLQTGDIMFQSHNFLSTKFGAAVKALFAGTGAEFAKTCWDGNKCAITAINSAAIGDKCSGGKVVYHKRNPRGGNAANTTTAEQARQLYKDRGLLMNISNTQTPVLLKDAANDPSNVVAQEFAIAQLAGSSPLTAPFPGMDEPWSSEKTAEFAAALELYEE